MKMPFLECGCFPCPWNLLTWLHLRCRLSDAHVWWSHLCTTCLKRHAAPGQVWGCGEVTGKPWHTTLGGQMVRFCRSECQKWEVKPKWEASMHKDKEGTKTTVRRAGICWTHVMGEVLCWVPSKFKVLGAKPRQARDRMLVTLARFCRTFRKESKWHDSGSLQPKARERNTRMGQACWSVLSRCWRREQPGRWEDVFGHIIPVWKEGWNLTPTTHFSKQTGGSGAYAKTS